MKNIISLILAVLILTSSAVGCSEKIPNETKSEPTAESSVQSNESAAEDDGSTHYYTDQAAVDYEGWELFIAGRPLNSSCFNVITVEDLTGDVFVDAVYNREIAVQDKFNIEITEIPVANVTDALTNSVSSNSGDYSLGYMLLTDELGLFANNVCIGVSDMPVLDLTKPYWDQGAIEDLSINGKMYYGLCDIGFGHYESSIVMFYNGVLLNNNQLDSPYDLYKEGKWTLDAMQHMLEVVSNDDNGDGKMKEGDDTFGFVGRTAKFQPPLAASGLNIVVWDPETNECTLDLTSDEIIAIGDKINAMLFDENIAIQDGDEASAMFKSGKALFYCALLGDYNKMRDTEDDYGIINWPSLTENTKGRMYTVNPEALFIPSDCRDPERLATVMEALNAYTYDYVIDDYVEKAVIGKGARDKQSAEIIREHFYVRAYDLADAFGLSSPHGAWKMALTKGIYASVEKKSSQTVKREMEAMLSELD